MRAAAILGPNASPRELTQYAAEGVSVEPVERLSSGFDVALLLGGDGTVHRHLPDLIESRLPALIVPHGSGNDFAHALGIRSRRQALALWRDFRAGRTRPRPLDAGIIMGADGFSRYFCNVGGVGVDAAANALANRMPPWLRGRGGYVLAALAALARYRPQPITATAQTAEGVVQFDGPALLAAFANSPVYGGGFRMAPRARLDDGRLDLCFIRSMSAARVLRHFLRIFSGRHLALPEVEYTHFTGLELSADPPLEVYADGEFICRTPVRVSLLRAALRVLAP